MVIKCCIQVFLRVRISRNFAICKPIVLRMKYVLLLFFCPFLSNAFGQESLSPQNRALVQISSEVAEGDLEKAASATHKGLNVGLSINKIKEIILHTHAYCGFPRSIRGLQTFMSVVEERSKQGISDPVGRDAQPNTSTLSRYEQGKEVLATLTGVPPSAVLSGYAAFAPPIERFLKEHLFADLFTSDVLSYTERELVTIAVIASIGEAEPMKHLLTPGSNRSAAAGFSRNT